MMWPAVFSATTLTAVAAFLAYGYGQQYRKRNWRDKRLERWIGDLEWHSEPHERLTTGAGQYVAMARSRRSASAASVRHRKQ